MTALVRAATVTTACERAGCREKVQQPARLLLAGQKNRFCGDVCARAQAPHLFCQACDQEVGATGPAYGILPICTSCRKLGWWSCWRKRAFNSSYDAAQWIRVYQATKRLRRDLWPYSCVLCGRWHNSSWDPWDVADDGYLDAITNLSVVINDYGFDVDQVRGWANNPDGSHELRDDTRVPDDILALVAAIDRAAIDGQAG